MFSTFKWNLIVFELTMLKNIPFPLLLLIISNRVAEKGVQPSVKGSGPISSTEGPGTCPAGELVVLPYHWNRSSCGSPNSIAGFSSSPCSCAAGRTTGGLAPVFSSPHPPGVQAPLCALLPCSASDFSPSLSSWLRLLQATQGDCFRMESEEVALNMNEHWANGTDHSLCWFVTEAW